MDIVLLVVLLVSALFIVLAVLFQRSSEEGLSGAITGGSDTYYGKEKTGGSQKMLFKWTIVFAIIFALAVLAVYVMQPDYTTGSDVNAWQDQYYTDYYYLFD